MKKILVIDGQGGKLGRLVIEQLTTSANSAASSGSELPFEITAIGTNSIATATMLKAGADNGATGENPVVVNCRDADIVIGPIGIIAADALHGEVTATMATAIGACRAHKILLPVSRCRISVIGVTHMPAAELVNMAVTRAFLLIGDNKNGKKNYP